MISMLKNVKTAKILSNSDKDMHQSIWIIPLMSNTRRELEGAKKIAKETICVKARASNSIWNEGVGSDF